ncbi:MAG: isochorismatase family cysteine hydrolase [Thermoplasmataceae archaeon]
MKELGRKIIFDTPQEILDPEHTVLIVWNVQNSFVRHTYNPQEFQRNIKSLLWSARMSRVRVIYSRYTEVDADFQYPWTVFLEMTKRRLTDPTRLQLQFQPGTGDSEIHESVEPAVNDIILNVRLHSLFYGSQFDSMMRAAGITTVVFSGVGTELGIENSVREASVMGYYTVVCKECVTTQDKSAQEISLKNMEDIALVYPLREILNQWKGRMQG